MRTNRTTPHSVQSLVAAVAFLFLMGLAGVAQPADYAAQRLPGDFGQQ